MWYLLYFLLCKAAVKPFWEHIFFFSIITLLTDKILDSLDDLVAHTHWKILRLEKTAINENFKDSVSPPLVIVIVQLDLLTHVWLFVQIVFTVHRKVKFIFIYSRDRKKIKVHKLILLTCLYIFPCKEGWPFMIIFRNKMTALNKLDFSKLLGLKTWMSITWI